MMPVKRKSAPSPCWMQQFVQSEQETGVPAWEDGYLSSRQGPSVVVERREEERKKERVMMHHRLSVSGDGGLHEA